MRKVGSSFCTAGAVEWKVGKYGRYRQAHVWVMCGTQGKVRGQRGGQWTAEVWRTGVRASLTIWTRICLRFRWRQSVLQLQWEVQSFLQGISHDMALQPPHFRGPAYLQSLFLAFSLLSVSISLACLQFPVCRRTFALCCVLSACSRFPIICEYGIIVCLPH